MTFLSTPILAVSFLLILTCSQVYLSYHGLGPHHFYVSRADQAPALARLMEEVGGDHVMHLTNLLGNDDNRTKNTKMHKSTRHH